MDGLPVLPLIKLPSSWPTVVTATVAMLGLALIDLACAFAAKQWVTTRSGSALTVGLVTALMLFWVFASALQYAEMAVITLGWIVLLQVGVLLLDELKYGVHHPPRTWAVVVMVMIAQGYLVCFPGGAGAG